MTTCRYGHEIMPDYYCIHDNYCIHVHIRPVDETYQVDKEQTKILKKWGSEPQHSTAARTDFRDIRPDEPQEWTPEYVHELLGFPNPMNVSMRWCYEKVADAHNAALKAVRQQWSDSESKRNIMSKMTIAEVEKLEQQLTAERDEWQLAVEECHRIISRKNDELTAEREKVKTLVELLRRLQRTRGCLTVNDSADIDAALAKVKHPIHIRNTAKMRISHDSRPT